MAIGAYTMAILRFPAGFSFWLALPCSMLVTMAFGVIVGLLLLRLRADYFAIDVLALAEVVRLFAQNARSLTGGNRGLFCAEDDASNCYLNAWNDVSDSINEWISNFWADPPSLPPLLLVVWVIVLLTFVLNRITYTPWGRVLRAIREDEGRRPRPRQEHDRLQAAVAHDRCAARLAGPARAEPEDAAPGGVRAAGHLLRLCRPHPRRARELPGSRSERSCSGSCSRGPATSEDLFTETRIAALWLAITGALLIGLMAFRLQGIFGKKEEMVPWRVSPENGASNGALLGVDGVFKRFGGIPCGERGQLQVPPASITALIGST